MRLQEVGLAIEMGGNRAFSWHVTRHDLADAVGMSNVHVNRSLQELRGRDLLDINRDQVTIYRLAWPQDPRGFRSGLLAAPPARPVGGHSSTHVMFPRPAALSQGIGQIEREHSPWRRSTCSPSRFGRDAMTG